MERVFGRIPVLECLRAGRRQAHRLFLLRGGRDLEAIRRAARVPVEEVARHELDLMAPGMAHQGVILEADPVPVRRMEDWARGPFAADAVAVALDGVEDPHNFGAVIRSAAACGACGVIFAKDRAAPLSPAAVKSAAGAVEYVDLVQVTNLVRSFGMLKEAGFWVAGLDAEGPQTLWEADLGGRVVLVVGSEGRGMRPLVRRHCDLLVRIPLTGPITSLNASVSAGVGLAECVRRRASAPNNRGPR